MIEPIPFAGIVKVPTERQTQVAEYIIKFNQENGRGPSTREVAKHLGCSQNNAWRLMRAVLKKGTEPSHPCAS
jgi:hypothetical protein